MAVLLRYEVGGLSVAPLFRLTTKGSASPGIAHRGLTAAVGSQFFTSASHAGAPHSAAGSVRVLEPGASRAIHWLGIAWGVNMEPLTFSAPLEGAQPLQVPLPNRGIGIHRGRLWVLRLEGWSEQNPALPKRAPTEAELVGVALAVLRWAVSRALGASTSALRTRSKDIGRRLLTRRPQ